MILRVEMKDENETEIMVEGEDRVEVKIKLEKKIKVREDRMKLFIGLIYL